MSKDCVVCDVVRMVTDGDPISVSTAITSAFLSGFQMGKASPVLVGPRHLALTFCMEHRAVASVKGCLDRALAQAR